MRPTNIQQFEDGSEVADSNARVLNHETFVPSRIDASLAIRGGPRSSTYGLMICSEAGGHEMPRSVSGAPQSVRPEIDPAKKEAATSDNMPRP